MNGDDNGAPRASDRAPTPHPWGYDPYANPLATPPAPQVGDDAALIPAGSPSPDPFVDTLPPPSSAPPLAPSGSGVGGLLLIAAGCGVLLLLVVGWLVFDTVTRTAAPRVTADGAMQQRAAAAGVTPEQLIAPPYCGVVIDKSMPSDTRAFLRARQTWYSSMAKWTERVRAQGGHYPIDRRLFVDIDRPFIDKVGAIQWSTQERARSADRALRAMSDYDRTVLAGDLPNADPQANLNQLREDLRAFQDAWFALRGELGLPESTCVFSKPQPPAGEDYT